MLHHSLAAAVGRVNHLWRRGSQLRLLPQLLLLPLLLLLLLLLLAGPVGRIDQQEQEQEQELEQELYQ